MPPRSVPEKLLEGTSAVALIAAIADVAFHWASLPQRIPIHFDSAGDPNGWGGKDMLLLLLLSTAVVGVLLTFAEHYQRLINIPINVDRDSPPVRCLLRSMVIVLKAVIMAMFLWIVDATMGTALGMRSGLGTAFLPAFLAGILLPVIFFLVKLKRL